jgi:peptidoglycan/LPS O-acetylase OafA/YrhL
MFMTDHRIQKLSYMPGLDGLRALAVFAVIGYHLGLPFLPGGFLGVTLFFALSGYLITDIILSEWNQDAKFSLKNFFLRRAKRLLPAVLFLLACMSFYIAVFQPDLLTNLKSAILPAVLFFSNWWYIISDTPYFASFATPSLLTHFWSLAVEAQFYLVWPVLLLLGQRFIRKKWLITALTFTAAVLSAVLMAVLYEPGTDPSRIYYGTDTRVFSLLLGACMAFLCPSNIITKPVRERTARMMLDVTGFVALAGVLFSIYFVTQYDDFLYLGGMFLFSLGSLLLIAAAANPSTVIGKLLSAKPLRYIGNISYGVYLWQFPVITITNAVFQTNRVNPVLCIVQSAITMIAATVSYYLIEKPIRRSKFAGSQGNEFVMKYMHTRGWKKTAAILVTALVFVSGIGFLVAKPMAETGEGGVNVLPSELQTNPADDTAAASETPASEVSPPEAAPVSASPDNNASSIAEHPDIIPRTPGDISEPVISPELIPSQFGVTLIGDSIGLGVTPYLKEYYPNLITEAEEGRQFYEAKNLIQEMLQNNEVEQTVIIVLGSNGLIKEAHLRSIIEQLGSDRKIVFVNTQVPRSWCSEVNSTLTNVSAEYANAIVADWYSASLDQSGYFCDDEVHPSKSGSLVLAKVIAEAVTKIHKPSDMEIAMATFPF